MSDDFDVFNPYVFDHDIDWDGSDVFQEDSKYDDIVVPLISPKALAGMAKLAETDFSVNMQNGDVESDKDAFVSVREDVDTQIVVDRYSESFDSDIATWCSEYAQELEMSRVHVRQLSGGRTSLAVEEDTFLENPPTGIEHAREPSAISDFQVYNKPIVGRGSVFDDELTF